MPTLKQARAALVGRVNTHWQAAYPAVKLYYDNAFPADAEIDTLDNYVLCEVRFSAAAQVNLSLTPAHRTHGVVVFTAAAREGAGSSKVLEYLDSLAGAMKFANFSSITTAAPAPGRPATVDGWFSYDLSVPFFFDS